MINYLYRFFFRRPKKLRSPNTVSVVEYKGSKPVYAANAPVTTSAAFEQYPIEAALAKTRGAAKVQPLTYSHYYGDWKHTTCITDISKPGDAAEFTVRFTGPGDYRLILEYACSKAIAGQEGYLEVAGEKFFFRTLYTGEFDRKAPLMFIKRPAALLTVEKPGIYHIDVKPYQQGEELFKLKSIIAEPL